MLRWLDIWLSQLAIKLIGFYQKTVSPDHGWLRFKYPVGVCRYQPTCSYYAIDCFKKYGFLKGSVKTIWRLLRCNPFNKGGYDPA